MVTPIAEKSPQKYGWILIFVVSIVIIINGLYFLLTGAESDAQLFQHMTGISWNTFTATGQGTATYVMGDLRILGLVLAIAGAQGAVVTTPHSEKGNVGLSIFYSCSLLVYCTRRFISTLTVDPRGQFT